MNNDVYKSLDIGLYLNRNFLMKKNVLFSTFIINNEIIFPQKIKIFK